MESAQNKERRSSSRKFHKKSRNSCLPCRRRRVKCNLQPPVCSNCHRRKESCSYISQTAQESTPLAVARVQEEISPGKINASDSPNSLKNTRNIELFTNWQALHGNESLRGAWQRALEPNTISPLIQIMEETFLLSLLPDIERQVFAREFTRLASAFEYVQRSFIALYELHEWSLSTSCPSLYTSAYQHHIEASMIFRHTQPKINSSNWMAVLTFGIGVIIFQFANFLKTPDMLDTSLELLFALRGSSKVAVELAPYLQISSIMLLTQPHSRPPNLHLDELTSNMLVCLDLLGYPDDTTDETKHACLHSVKALKRWIVEVNGCPRNWRQFIDWPAAVSEQYLTALSQKHATSLVIFVHWCAIMNRCPKRWYMVGWANRAATIAMRQLGEEWDRALEIPRALLATEAEARYPVHNLKETIPI
ncbi:uncharacterized protein F4812DRAFT_40746 [Daldinia caldariorum]|uniref:uncharacterized protein n=1 Tax=Daldinia caldariorum TaxID=326644 RepID=UPI002007BA96|nr:uncharacterized protein F4812DRAFT_40746 [Daldinia caldariorum]KAI1473140.1 hypothetical protein F4812DRAFT_40746 [Daldinia caldariorum]